MCRQGVSDSDDVEREERGDHCACCAVHNFAADESGVNWFACLCHNCLSGLVGRSGEYSFGSNAVPIIKTVLVLVGAVGFV